MVASTLLPLLACGLFAAVAPQVARRVPAVIAVWLLSLGGLLVAVFGLAAVAVVVATGVVQLPWVAHLGHWSPDALHRMSPFHPWAVGFAALLLLVAAALAVRSTVSQFVKLRSAWGACRDLPTGLVVLSDPRPYAYAVPGWPGRIVASTSLLRGLDAPGRRAVLEHEHTHLREHHDLHLVTARVAAALNPLLSGLPAAVILACERRADVCATRAVGDAGIVARAIATAVRPPARMGAWAAAGADLPWRVRSLLAPTPRAGGVLAVMVLGVALAVLTSSGLSVLWLGHDLDNVLDVAGLG